MLNMSRRFQKPIHEPVKQLWWRFLDNTFHNRYFKWFTIFARRFHRTCFDLDLNRLINLRKKSLENIGRDFLVQ